MGFLGIDFFGLEAKKAIEQMCVENRVLASELAGLISILEENSIEIPPELAAWKIRHERTRLTIELYKKCVEKAIGVGLVDPKIIDLL